METRNISKIKDQFSASKRLKDSAPVTPASPADNSLKAPRLSSGDKTFLVALIRESESLTAQHIKDSIRESEKTHFDHIKSLISESEQRIRSLVESEFQSFRNAISDITERVRNLEVKCEQVDNLKVEICELKKKLLASENSIVADSIRISGIPFVENEDLSCSFNNICQNLNIIAPQVKNIYRLRRIYKLNKPQKPKEEDIVVKLQSPYAKNFLLKSIARHKRENRSKLTLRHAGIQSDQPIYINEDLTPHNHKILMSALRLKRDGKIHSAYTLRGLVYVRKRSTDEPVLMEYIEDLDKLFR